MAARSALCPLDPVLTCTKACVVADLAEKDEQVVGVDRMVRQQYLNLIQAREFTLSAWCRALACGCRHSAFVLFDPGNPSWPTAVWKEIEGTPPGPPRLTCEPHP